MASCSACLDLEGLRPPTLDFALFAAYGGVAGKRAAVVLPGVTPEAQLQPSTCCVVVVVGKRAAVVLPGVTPEAQLQPSARCAVAYLSFN